MCSRTSRDGRGALPLTGQSWGGTSFYRRKCAERGMWRPFLPQLQWPPGLLPKEGWRVFLLPAHSLDPTPLLTSFASQTAASESYGCKRFKRNVCCVLGWACETELDSFWAPLKSKFNSCSLLGDPGCLGWAPPCFWQVFPVETGQEIRTVCTCQGPHNLEEIEINLSSAV